MNENPVKVLHLIPTLSNGGAERQLVNLVRSTSKNIIAHTVCVIGEADFYLPLIRKADCAVIKFNITKKRPFIQAAREFRKIIMSVKPDIIHTWLYDASISARLAIFSNRNIPIITSLQAPDYEPEFINIGNWNPQKVKVLKKIDKFTSSLFKSYFVPCSYYVKKSYQHHYDIDERKTEVIYNCVDLSFLLTDNDEIQKLRNELRLPSDAFIYLNVGRLDPQKNHKNLIRAFGEVSKNISNVYLILVGVGSLENELKSLVKNLHIEERVIFLGRRKDVRVLLELADVFVFPSHFEGLPLALIEAMSKSLPCIGSKIEVFEEIITDKETGLLVDQNSIEDLKNSMIRLYEDEGLRKKLGENGFQRVKQKFNATVSAAQWEKFYLRVLAENTN